MKIRALACCLLAAVPALLQAQTLTYSLPRTTMTVEVEAEQETFFAGPYAGYAKKYLGIDVRQRNQVRTNLREIRLLSRVEADPSARYTAESRGAEDRFLALSSQGLIAFQDKAEAGEAVWRFAPQVSADFTEQGVTSTTRTEVRTTWKEVETDTAFVRVPVEEKVKVEKSMEARAEEAARMVLKAREERFNISSGNTDATFSGEALGAALAELDRIEKEYLALFTGYSVVRPLTQSFDVIPVPGSRKQQYLAFRLSDADGLVTSGSGTPYYLEFEPEESEEAQTVAKDVRNAIRYRVPAICKVKLVVDSYALCQARVPVYQLGLESAYPLK